jgi:hypothetical protein
MSGIQEHDLLLVIAQLAVAFAGFASLASALGDRGGDDGRRVDAGRLTNMLVTSLCTTMLAFVPFLPSLFGVADDLAWRASAGVAFLAMAVVAPGILARTKRMKVYASFNATTNAVNVGLAGVAAAGFALSAFGLPPSNPAATFIAALLVLLGICAILFLRVIVSLLSAHDPG